MRAEQAKRMLLDFGWSAAERAAVSEMLQMIEQDEECRAAAADYDRVRLVLQDASDDSEFTRSAGVLTERLREALAERRGAPRVLRRFRIPAFAAAGVAAALLIVGLISNELPMQRAPARDARAAAPISSAEAATRLALFDQVSEVFDGRAGWILVSDSAADFGLGGTARTAGVQPIVFRLVLYDAQRVVSRSDLVMLPGQAADVSVPLSAGHTLVYKMATSAANPLEPSVWAEVQDSESDQALGAIATQLQLQSDQYSSAGQIVTRDGRFELRITVATSKEARS